MRRALPSGLRLQKGLSRIAHPFVYILVWGWMRFVRRYSIAGLAPVRREFRRRTGATEHPWLICANHLTLIDSFVLIWGLGGAGFYLANPRLFAWNLPEKTNFYRNPFSRLLCYLGKCVPVVRGGGAECARRAEESVDWLVRAGESIMIFPEGTRSRSGFVEPAATSYAVGSIIARNPPLRVLCVYLRGEGQSGFGDLPRAGEVFRLRLREVYPRTSYSGMRAWRDLSFQVAGHLKDLEEEHFAAIRADRQ